jgi:hypothetical protein
MKYPASKYIPGLGSLFFIDPSHINAKGGAEKYIPGLGSQVEVKLSEVDAKGGAEKYIPGLGTQFFIHPDHVEGHVVTFTVTASSVAVAGAEVVVGGTTVITDAAGKAVFTLVDGTHSYTVSKALYDDVTDTVVVNGADVSEPVTLTLT